MLPINQVWYRKLLAAALGLGLAGGFIALVYSGVTEGGIEFFFGEVRDEPWSGEWWWIPLIAGGALVVVALRRWLSVADQVPGTIAYARRAWVEPSSAFPLVAISAISLMVGASLGPSFGVTLAGGGLGSWLATRASADDEEVRHDYTLTGMSGSFGGLFSAPVFSVILVAELSPTQKKDYLVAMVPELIAATIGYVIFFGITGKVMLDTFDAGDYSYETIHLVYGAALGALSVVTLIVYTTVGKIVKKVTDLVPNRLTKAGVAGALVGLLAFALPLTVTSGSGQLAFEAKTIPDMTLWLLTAALLVGGVVFPMIFIGGTAGIIVHEVFTDIPAALAIAAMVAAVPGAIISAPIGFTLLAVGTVGAGVGAIAPVAIAVIVAQLTVASVKYFRSARQSM
jgi:H+/Cl- antiporter ClcA